MRAENPDYDALVVAGIRAGAVFEPGRDLPPIDMLEAGAVVSAAILAQRDGSVDTRLPVSELFNGAAVQGRDASLAMDLPPILRFGVELTTWQKRLRVELAYTAEF